MKTLAVVCGGPEEFSQWKREAYPIAARFGTDRTYPVWSMERLLALRGIQIDNFTCYGSWHLLKDRDEIIDRLEDVCPVAGGDVIRPCGIPASMVDKVTARREAAYLGAWFSVDWSEGISEEKTVIQSYPTYGTQKRNAAQSGEYLYDPFPPTERDTAIQELTAIARRLSQQNLNELVEIAKTIQALHPAKREEEDPLYGASIGTGYLEKYFKSAPAFQFGFSGFKRAMLAGPPVKDESIPVHIPPVGEEKS